MDGKGMLNYEISDKDRQLIENSTNDLKNHTDNRDWSMAELIALQFKKQLLSINIK
jgi:uncharacterized membrane-anchored protein